MNEFYKPSVKEVADRREVRRATMGDSEVVWSLIEADSEWLLNQLGFNHWSSYYTEEIIKNNILTHEVYLLNVEGVAAGTISIDTTAVDYYTDEVISTFEEPTVEALYLSCLAIIPSLHGKGLGSELLLLAEENARQKGMRFLRLDCRAEYTQLVQFYLKRGYKICGTLNEGPEENYYVMEKKLQQDSPDVTVSTTN
jgi:ribosomal protein S18 acetylase RimI-like enzyme